MKDSIFSKSVQVFFSDFMQHSKSDKKHSKKSEQSCIINCICEIPLPSGCEKENMT